MASKPQPTIELYDSNVGPAKLPGDRYLRDIADETLLGLNPTTYADRKATNPAFGADVGNVGPAKLPGDLVLSKKLDPESDILFRTKQATEQPRGSVGPDWQVKTGSIAILAQRRSVESFLGIGNTSLDQDENPISFLYHEGVLSPARYGRQTDSPFENTQTTFDTIQDVGLTASQMERYQDIVDTGRLDTENLFQSKGGALGNLFGFNRPGFSQTAISYKQAVDIVVGNSREGISRFDPTTGETWDLKDLRVARDLQNQYLAYQGLPAIYQGNTIPGVGPNEFLFQRAPFDESELTRQGTGGERQQIRGDNLNYQLTMEEAVQVAELVSGRSRIYQNPRQAQDNPSFDETLLYGEYVL